MALDSTVAGANAVSYASVQQAETYFNSHWRTSLTSLWKGLKLQQKESLLASATRVLETLPVLDVETGASQIIFPLTARDLTSVLVTRFDSAQALQFPRNIDVDEDGNASIPDPVKEALYLQAAYLVTFDDSVLAAQLQGITEEAFTADNVKGYSVYGAQGSMLAPHSFTLMRPLLRKSRSKRIVRG